MRFTEKERTVGQDVLLRHAQDVAAKVEVACWGTLNGADLKRVREALAFEF